MILSPLSRSALGSLSPKQYTNLITSELCHFLIGKKISDGYTKEIAKEFITHYLTDSLNYEWLNPWDKSVISHSDE